MTEPETIEADAPVEPDVPGAALEVATPASTVPHSTMPAPAEWKMIREMADLLASSDLVPAAYRRKPANVILATLAGRPFGWDATMAMRSFHVIEGVPSMKPEVMLALVRRAGHSVSGETSPTKAVVHGTRRDTGDTMSAEFTIEQARAAGLAQKQVWKSYPASMLWARALSQLCRMLFPDVVLGAGYTPEELDGRIADDDVIDVADVDGFTVDTDDHGRAIPPPGWISRTHAKQLLLERCNGDADCARALWSRWPVDQITDDGLVPEDSFTGWLANQPAPGAPEAPLTGADVDPHDGVEDAVIVDETATQDDTGPSEPDPAELAYAKLLLEAQQMTAKDLAARIRENGGTPRGAKADLVEMWAAAQLPGVLAELDAAGA